MLLTSKKVTEDKQVSHQKVLSDLEKKSIIKDYKKYLMLTDDQKKSLYGQWNEYYKKCAQSPEAMLFWELQPLFKHVSEQEDEEKSKRLKELSNQAREMLINGDWYQIPKPPLRDPLEFRFSQDVHQYNTSLEIIDQGFFKKAGDML